MLTSGRVVHAAEIVRGAALHAPVSCILIIDASKHRATKTHTHTHTTGGSTASTQSISTWCSKYSGWSQSSCQCIMQHESGGNANAVNQNGNGGSYDVGLWQINDMNWASCSGGAAPCDPSKNLACAEKVFAWGGNTWKLWATCSTCGVCNSK